MIAFTEDSELEFSARLKMIRQEVDMSQTELADAAGIHYTMISRYERGESSPNTETLRAIADALDVTADYLLDGFDADEFSNAANSQKLMNGFRKVAKLPSKDQETVLELINAFVLKNKMTEFLAE